MTIGAKILKANNNKRGQEQEQAQFTYTAGENIKPLLKTVKFY